MTKIVLVDLFSGIGGFAEGLRRAGVEFAAHYFAEVAPGPISIYKKHFQNAEELGDVTAIRDFSGIKQRAQGVPLVLTAGFPCQDLSIAGKRRGLDGERSGLFFEAIRCIRELRPDVFIFENVKGLFTSHGGRDFVRFLQEIADLGDYDCQWQLVDTDWFLPQNRERVYFVGCSGAFAGRQIFPLGGRNLSPAVISNEQALCITATYGDNVGNGSYVVESKRLQKVKQINRTPKNHQQDRVYSTDGSAPCLNSLPGGNLEPKILVYPRGKNPGGLRDGSCPAITANSFQQNIMVCPVVTPGRHRKKQNGRLIKDDGDPSFTLTARESPGIYDGRLVRKLTPLECERLQGFSDGWTEYGADGKRMSDSVRYKALGNAVSVPVPEAIARALFN